MMCSSRSYIFTLIKYHRVGYSLCSTLPSSCKREAGVWRIGYHSRDLCHNYGNSDRVQEAVHRHNLQHPRIHPCLRRLRLLYSLLHHEDIKGDVYTSPPHPANRRRLPHPHRRNQTQLHHQTRCSASRRSNRTAVWVSRWWCLQSHRL